MMYALGVSFLLATSNAFSPMGGRVSTRATKLSMSTMTSPVATEAILATVSHLFKHSVPLPLLHERKFRRYITHDSYQFISEFIRLPEMPVASPLTLSQRYVCLLALHYYHVYSTHMQFLFRTYLRRY